jgi:hypothetical protein
MNLLILVVDDEPDVEALFRQQFRREMRAGGSSWISRPPAHRRSSASKKPKKIR